MVGLATHVGVVLTFAHMLAALTMANKLSAFGFTVTASWGKRWASLDWYLAASPTVSTKTLRTFTPASKAPWIRSIAVSCDIEFRLYLFLSNGIRHSYAVKGRKSNQFTDGRDPSVCSKQTATTDTCQLRSHLIKRLKIILEVYYQHY